MKVIHLSLCIVVAVGLSAACSKTESAQAKGREAPARAVATDAVRQEEAKRSVEVVGTLAAEDQVTIASQAEGAVSRVLVDLGDHVKAGQPLIELDREKLKYNLQNQKAALARALAKYGATEPGHLPATGDTPDVKKADAELRQAKKAFDRAEELNKRQLIPRQALDNTDTTLRAKQAAYESSLQNARISAPTSMRRTRCSSWPIVSCRCHDPRAVRWLRAEALVSSASSSRARRRSWNWSGSIR